MYLDSGSGIFAIMALAYLRALPPLDVFGAFQPKAFGWVRSYPSWSLRLRPSGFHPLPLVVLCATLNHEPPMFLIARASCKALPCAAGLNACPGRVRGSSGCFQSKPPTFTALNVGGISAGTSPQR